MNNQKAALLGEIDIRLAELDKKFEEHIERIKNNERLSKILDVEVLQKWRQELGER